MTGLPPGAVLAGRFRIEHPVGAGGFGCVYRAIDNETGRAVAIKTSETDPARLIRESKIAARVHHPNIVEVHGHLSDPGAGLDFMLMEWVPGQPLSALCGHLSAAEFDPLLAQICDGLGAAHKAGVVHRDMTPSNIMVTENNQVRIIDWGSARDLGGGDGGVTSEDTLVGTVGYLAPEVVTGAGGPSIGSDVYALAALTYEVLAGDHPFAGHPLIGQLGLRIVCRAQPEPISSRTLKPLPKGLDATLLGALDKDPTGRPASVSEFYAGWKAAIAGQPETLGAPKRWGLWAIAAGALATLGLVVALTHGPKGGGVEPTEPVRNPEEAAQPVPTPDANTAPLARTRVENARQSAEIKAMVGTKDPSTAKSKAQPSAQKLKTHIQAWRWGAIKVDGRPCGDDECALMLTPGKHRVEIEQHGAVTRRTITVTPDKTAFSIAFVPPL